MQYKDVCNESWKQNLISVPETPIAPDGRLEWPAEWQHGGYRWSLRHGDRRRKRTIAGEFYN